MEIIGFIAAGLIGLSLGLIGGGGSIITVPMLVYLFGIAPTTATSYSLFIVGVTSLTGAYKNYRKQQIDKTTVLNFGLASVTTVFLVRQFIFPIFPDQLFTIGTNIIYKSDLIMLLFAALMLLAAFYMIRSRAETTLSLKPANTPKLLIYGVLLGLVTGLLGAGGGFLVVPVLILLKMPMKMAIGTSLTIISATSLLGFSVDLWKHTIEWSLLIPITAVALAGIFIGAKMNEKVDSVHLKRGFGWFVMAMGVFILIKQAIQLFDM